jgi:hypothetical protein
MIANNQDVFAGPPNLIFALVNTLNHKALLNERFYETLL